MFEFELDRLFVDCVVMILCQNDSPSNISSVFVCNLSELEIIRLLLLFEFEIVRNTVLMDDAFDFFPCCPEFSVSSSSIKFIGLFLLKPDEFNSKYWLIHKSFI